MNIVFETKHDRFVLVPDFDTPNKIFIYDLKNGKSVVAIFYDVPLAHITINYLNETEMGLQQY